MRLTDSLYVIRSFEAGDGVVEASVTLNHDSVIYKAHFPNHPVTPGVCVMQIAVELAAKALGMPGLWLTGAKNVKFLNVIEPSDGTVVLYRLTVTRNGETEVRLSGTASVADVVCAKLSLTCAAVS